MYHPSLYYTSTRVKFVLEWNTARTSGQDLQRLFYTLLIEFSAECVDWSVRSFLRHFNRSPTAAMLQVYHFSIVTFMESVQTSSICWFHQSGPSPLPENRNPSVQVPLRQLFPQNYSNVEFTSSRVLPT